MGRKPYQKYNILCTGPWFSDISTALQHALARLGYDCTLSQTDLPYDCTNIILGAHTIENDDIIPDGSIVFNLEQLSSRPVMVRESYFALLKRHIIWDYSRKNISYIEDQIGNKNTELVRIGYSESNVRLDKNVNSEEDIDILFIGSLNKRRLDLLHKFSNYDTKTVIVKNLFGDKLWEIINRAKLVLNIQYYPGGIFEIIRTAPLIANKKAVVTELSEGLEIDPIALHAVRGAPYAHLIETCMDLLADADMRRDLQQTGFETFSRYPQHLLLPLSVIEHSPLRSYMPEYISRDTPSR